MRSTGLLYLVLTVSFASAAGEWPRFRGPLGAGAPTEPTSLPSEWEPGDARFTLALPGAGNGSPAVWDDRVFLLCGDARSGDRIPVCVHAHEGTILWQRREADQANKHHRFNSLASATPAVDAERVYFAWGTKDAQTVTAYTHAGEPAWKVDLGGVKGGHGYAASPMLHDGLLILNRDQAKGFLVALDAATGEERWRVARRSQRLSYSTPVVFPHRGGDQLVFTNWRHGFTGVEPASGEVLWDRSVFDTNTNERAISSPVVAGDLVIGTCGFTTNPKHCVAIRPGRDGAEEVWRVEKSVPHIPSPLVVGEHVYLWEDKGIVSCLRHADGTQVWKGRVPGDIFGSPVVAGDHIYAVTRDGLIHCIQAGPELRILGGTDLDELCRATPAIAHGRLYVRTETRLHAFGGAR